MILTPEHEIVWEYISPYFGALASPTEKDQIMKMNLVYRAYRVPYEWIPQMEKPEGRPIERLDVTKFRVPGSLERNPQNVTKVKANLRRYGEDTQMCITN